jgi:hypothetical protein
MSLPKPGVNQRDVVMLQRDPTNAAWEEIHISGSELMFFTDPATGNLTADKLSVVIPIYAPGGSVTAVVSSSFASSSWASHFASGSNTSSWATSSLTSSYMRDLGKDSPYMFTASWASSSISASWAPGSTAATAVESSSFASSSWASHFASGSNTSSWATSSLTASYIDQGAFSNVIVFPLEYKFDTSTGASDPGSSKFRFNSATPASIGNIYVNDTTNGGLDASKIIDRFKSGSTQLYIQQKDDAGNAFLFSVKDAPVDNTGWFTVPVEYDTSVGVVPGNNKPCAFVVINRFYIETGSTYPVTASWAISASWAVSASWSTASISASYAKSSSYAVSASFATSASYEIIYELSSSYAETSSWAVNAITASNSVSSSWAFDAVSASYAPGGSAATYTSSLWGTASWAESASWAPTPNYTSSLFGTASYAISASHLSGSYSVLKDLSIDDRLLFTATRIRIGNAAGKANPVSATNAVHVGYLAGFNSTNAAGATQIGTNAGINSITATGATQVGFNAGNASITATNAVQVGNQAGYGATAATEAVQVGYNAGFSAANGAYTTFIGSSADAADGALNVSKSIAIGYNAKVSASSTCVIGGVAGGADAVKVTIGGYTAANTLDVMGNISASSVTASLQGTASWAVSASWAPGGSAPTYTSSLWGTASWAVSASWAPGASAATYTSSLWGTASWAESASNAVSASWAPGASAATYTSSLWGTASWAQNAPYGRSIVLCAAYTPTATGADAAEIPVPYSPLDGTTAVSWSVRRLAVRTVTAETSTSSINFERSEAAGVFSGIFVGALTHSYGLYQANTGSFAKHIISGDKVRFNVITLGASTYWTVVVEASYP